MAKSFTISHTNAVLNFTKYYCTSTVELLNSNLQQGISENDCEALREKYGTNKIDLPSKNKLYKHVLNAIKEKTVIIYLIISIML